MNFKMLMPCLLCASIAWIGCASQMRMKTIEDKGKSHYEDMKEMFHEMVVKKDATLIPKYYHPQFLLFSNGQQMDYAETVRFHREIYKTPIQYSFEFDPETVVEQGDRVA